MKKKLFSLFIFFILIKTYTPLNAQGYQSFFGENKTTWNIFNNLTCYLSTEDPDPHILGGCSVTAPITITQNDTISYNGVTYYITNNPIINENIIFREDTDYGRVFRYIPQLHEEYLVCDMNLMPGDTFYFAHENIHGYYRYLEGGGFIIVDSINFFNEKKIIYFGNIHYRDEEFLDIYWTRPYIYHDYVKLTFIEGIGPTYGTFGFVSFGEPNLGLMLCLEKDDTLAYMASSLLGCNQWGVSITKNELNPIQLSPNPASTEIRLSLQEDKIVEGIIIIIDAVGRVMYHQTLHSSNEIINIAHYSPGIYILQCITKYKKYQSKFVKIN
jgi:hypothetical protein